MNRTRTHLATAELFYTKCGQTLDLKYITSLRADVTCRSCIRTKGARKSRAQSDAQTLARENPNYGDPNYPGRGFLRCRNCNRPYTEHPLAVACPYEGSR